MHLSIIVPVYNVATYLRDCLDSVQNQSCSHWQCVCIDDGSTDGSGAILDEIKGKDSRFVVVHQQNQGVSAARNTGLRVATGNWIGFLDGDDVWSPFAVEVWSKIVCEEENVDVVAFGVRNFDLEESVKWPSPCLAKKEKVDLRNIYPSRAETEMAFFGKFYRRSILSGSLFPLYRNGEDIVFLVDALLRANYMVVIPSALYGYRQRPDGATKNVVTERRLLDYLHCTMDIVQLLHKANKCVDGRMFRKLAIGMTEGFMLKLSMRVCPIDDCRNVWNLWRDCLREMVERDWLAGFQKTRVRFFLLCPFYWLAWILFYVPAWLKLHGVHR